jgi:hypothetical protein
MLTPEDRAKVANLGDQLINLYTRRAEACGQEDLASNPQARKRVQSGGLF